MCYNPYCLWVYLWHVTGTQQIYANWMNCALFLFLSLYLLCFLHLVFCAPTQSIGLEYQRPKFCCDMELAI